MAKNNSIIIALITFTNDVFAGGKQFWCYLRVDGFAFKFKPDLSGMAPAFTYLDRMVLIRFPYSVTVPDCADKSLTPVPASFFPGGERLSTNPVGGLPTRLFPADTRKNHPLALPGGGALSIRHYCRIVLRFLIRVQPVSQSQQNFVFPCSHSNIKQGVCHVAGQDSLFWYIVN